MLVVDLDTSLRSVAMTCHERLADALVGATVRAPGVLVPPRARSASSAGAPGLPDPDALRFMTLDLGHEFNSLD